MFIDTSIIQGWLNRVCSRPGFFRPPARIEAKGFSLRFHYFTEAALCPHPNFKSVCLSRISGHRNSFIADTSRNASQSNALQPRVADAPRLISESTRGICRRRTPGARQTHQRRSLSHDGASRGRATVAARVTRSRAEALWRALVNPASTVPRQPLSASRRPRTPHILSPLLPPVWPKATT